MNAIRRLIREAHRRSLWQVVGIYVVGAWVALQVVDTLADAVALPDWVPGLALALLIIGLPIVLATAFVQEGQAPAEHGAGAERAAADPTRFDTPAETAARAVLTWRNAILGGVVATVLWGAVAGGWVLLRPGGSGFDGEPSIAVLPFANRSSEADSEFFVDGIHDDVLTQLSKIGSLRVISRTSVMRYRDAAKSIPEIARDLGVAAVLEGGVERAGGQVRIHVQLIDARTDRHLWAESYDTVLTAASVFAIRSELARKIAAALEATLTPAEQRRIDRPATDNFAAYELVLRGRDLYDGDAEDVEKALELFRQATRLAPDYAEAFAWLANAYAQRVQKGGFGATMADSAIAAAGRAIELDAELPEAHKALGLALDQSGRLSESGAAYRRALELSPNWTVPMTNLSATASWLGRCDEGVRLMTTARALAPNDPFPPGHLALHYGCLRLDDEAARWLDTARAVDPDWYWTPIFEGTLALARKDTARMARLAGTVLTRNGDDPFGLWMAGQAFLIAGDFEESERWWARLYRQSPDWGFRANAVAMRTSLAYVRRRLGRPEGTAALLDEAVALARSALDRGLDDPDYLVQLARAHTVRGETEEGIRVLTRLAQESYYAPPVLDRDPLLEPLHSDVRFRSFLDGQRARAAAMRANIATLETTP